MEKEKENIKVPEIHIITPASSSNRSHSMTVITNVDDRMRSIRKEKSLTLHKTFSQRYKRKSKSLLKINAQHKYADADRKVPRTKKSGSVYQVSYASV